MKFFAPAVLLFQAITFVASGAPPLGVELASDVVPMTAEARRNLSALFSSDTLGLDTLRRPFVQRQVDAKMRAASAMWNAMLPEHPARISIAGASDETLRHLREGRPPLAVVRGSALEKLSPDERRDMCIVVEIRASAARRQEFLLVGAKARPTGRRIAIAERALSPDAKDFTAGTGAALRDDYDNFEDVSDDIVDGVFDQTVMTREAWESYRRRKPARAARLAIRAESGSFPPPVLVANCRLVPPATLEAMRARLTTAHEHPGNDTRLMLGNFSGIRARRFVAPTH